MKRIALFLASIVLGTGSLYALTKQAKSETAIQINVPSGAGVDGVKISQSDATKNAINVTSGGVVFTLKTIAALDALTPVTTGQYFTCSDCTQSALCISSGTTQGAWVIAIATGTKAGSTWSGFAHCN